MEAGTKVRVTTKESNLNIRRAGTDSSQSLAGAAHGEIITLISQANDFMVFCSHR